MNLMILRKCILFVFILSVFTNVLSAQVYVKPNLNVVVGDTSGLYIESRFNVNSPNQRSGIGLFASINNPTFKDTSIIYGIYNQFNPSSLGLQSPYNYVFTRAAYKSQFNTRQDVYNNGLYLSIYEIPGVGIAPPSYHNKVETNGIVIGIDSAQNNYNGVFLYFDHMNCTQARGYGNYFVQLPQGGNIPTNLNTNFYGHYNQIIPNSNTYSYGQYNIITTRSGFTGQTFGTYTKIDGDTQIQN